MADHAHPPFDAAAMARLRAHCATPCDGLHEHAARCWLATLDAALARAEAAEARLAQQSALIAARLEGESAGDEGLGPEANPYAADAPGTLGPAGLWELARWGVVLRRRIDELGDGFLKRAEAAERERDELQAAVRAYVAVASYDSTMGHLEASDGRLEAAEARLVALLPPAPSGEASGG